MTDMFLLSADQMSKIEPFFPKSHGVARLDDCRVISGIIYVLKHGLQWKDAPPGDCQKKIGFDRECAIP